MRTDRMAAAYHQNELRNLRVPIHRCYVQRRHAVLRERDVGVRVELQQGLRDHDRVHQLYDLEDRVGGDAVPLVPQVVERYLPEPVNASS